MVWNNRGEETALSAYPAKIVAISVIEKWESEAFKIGPILSRLPSKPVQRRYSSFRLENRE